MSNPSFIQYNKEITAIPSTTKHKKNTIARGIHNTIKQIFLCSIFFIYAHTAGNTISIIHTIKLIIGNVVQDLPPSGNFRSKIQFVIGDKTIASIYPINWIARIFFHSDLNIKKKNIIIFTSKDFFFTLIVIF